MFDGSLKEDNGTFMKNINSIRALAIFMVITQHYAYFVSTRLKFSLNNLTLMVVSMVDVSVDLFSMLSGMLLTISLINNSSEKNSWKKWYKKRLLRIYPLLIFSTLLYMLIYLIFPYSFNFNTFLIHMSGLQSVPTSEEFFLIAHFPMAHWYVTFILSCYLIFPLVFYFLNKSYKITSSILFILFIFFFLFPNQIYNGLNSLSILIFKKELNYGNLGYFALRYFDFLFGMILGFIIAKKKINREKYLDNRKMILISIIIIIFIYILYNLFNLHDHTLWNPFIILTYPLMCVLIIIICNYCLSRIQQINKILEIPGKESYAIFLLHEIVIFFFILPVFDNLQLLLSLPIIILFCIFIIYPFYILDTTIQKSKKSHKFILILSLSLISYTIVNYIFNLEHVLFNFYLALLFIIIFGIISLIYYYSEMWDYLKSKSFRFITTSKTEDQIFS